MASPKGLAALGRLPIPRRTVEKASTIHGGCAFADVESLRLKLANKEAPETSLLGAMTQPVPHQTVVLPSAVLSSLDEDPPAKGCFSPFRCFSRRRSQPRKEVGSTSSPLTPPQPFYKDDNSVKAGGLMPYIVEGDAPLSKNELYRRGYIRFPTGPPRNALHGVNSTGKGWTVHGANHFSQRIIQHAPVRQPGTMPSADVRVSATNCVR